MLQRRRVAPRIAQRAHGDDELGALANVFVRPLGKRHKPWIDLHVKTGRETPRSETQTGRSFVLIPLRRADYDRSRPTQATPTARAADRRADGAATVSSSRCPSGLAARVLSRVSVRGCRLHVCGLCAIAARRRRSSGRCRCNLPRRSGQTSAGAFRYRLRPCRYSLENRG